MRAILIVLMSIAGAALLVGPAPAAVAAEESEVLRLSNASRAEQGLGPLAMNDAMNAVALAWAQAMASEGQLSHNPHYAAQIPRGWSSAAENVATGYRGAAALHAGWMGSPGHRANILGDFTDIGIAHISVGGSTWSVEVFAKYGDTVPAPLTASGQLGTAQAEGDTPAGDSRVAPAERAAEPTERADASDAPQLLERASFVADPGEFAASEADEGEIEASPPGLDGSVARVLVVGGVALLMVVAVVVAMVWGFRPRHR